MVTKAEIIARIATKSAQEIDRLNNTLLAWAQAGQVGGSYVFDQYVQVADAQAARNAAIAAGWAVTIDVPSRTMTLS